MSHREKKYLSWPSAVVVVMMVVVAVYLSWLSGVKAEVFDALSLDLGNMWQSMWNVAHGHGFVFSFAEYGRNVSRLGVHADYLLILLSPLTWLTTDPRVLLWSQAIVVAAGAWFIWRIACHWLRRSGIALIMAIGYLFYGPLQFAVVWQFHAETMAVTFILAAVEALVAHRRRWVVWLWFGLAVISKEHIGLLIGPVAWWLARSSSLSSGVDDRAGWSRQAWWLLAIGVAFSLMHILLIIPANSPDGRHFVWDYYFGADRVLGLDPRATPRFVFEWSNLVSRNVLTTAGFLLLPMGLLAVFSPVVLIAGAVLLPQWLSHVTSKHTIFFHNHVLAIPFIWMATILGWQRLATWLSGRRSTAVMARTLPGWFVLWTILGSLVVGPNAWSLTFNPRTLERNPNLATVRTMKQFVPADASVAYSKYAGAWWRDRVSSFPIPYRVTDSDIVVIVSPPPGYRPEYPSEVRHVQIENYFQTYLESSRAFATIYDDSHNQIFRRDWNEQPGTIAAEFMPITIPSKYDR